MLTKPGSISYCRKWTELLSCEGSVLKSMNLDEINHYTLSRNFHRMFQVLEQELDIEINGAKF